jgi:hypothetical protein
MVQQVTEFDTADDLDFYPESNGKPMAENTIQFRWIVLIKEGLEIRRCISSRCICSWRLTMVSSQR